MDGQRSPLVPLCSIDVSKQCAFHTSSIQMAMHWAILHVPLHLPYRLSPHRPPILLPSSSISPPVKSASRPPNPHQKQREKRKKPQITEPWDIKVQRTHYANKVEPSKNIRFSKWSGTGVSPTTNSNKTGHRVTARRLERWRGQKVSSALHAPPSFSTSPSAHLPGTGA